MTENYDKNSKKIVYDDNEKHLDFPNEIIYNISYRARFIERRTLMKKDYMKPEGKVVAMSVRENIASSEGSSSDTYKIQYTWGEVPGVRYIQGSNYPATDTNNEAFDSFYDMVKTYLYGLDNCRGD
jgi:hypothetical protein